MKRFIFLYSHPIQYFAPLSKHLAEAADFDITVLYCSTKGVQKSFDREFGVELQWDIPLLEGYKYVFLPNKGAEEGTVAGFWSLRNWSVLKELWKRPKSYIVIHGWSYFTHCLTLLIAPVLGHKVCLRSETPLKHELAKPGSKQFFRYLFFRFFLLKWVHYCLFIGNENRAFYKHFNVPDSKLIFTPYVVDNSRFQGEYENLKPVRSNLRMQLNVPLTALVFVFTAKYIPKKRPLDLLKAFAQFNHLNSFLIMVGDGHLKEEMNNFICANHMQSKVLLTGFVNQQIISMYYTIADVFVMCSEYGETWGLSTNEAMNFDLPIIISDVTGCASDLVHEGENGYTFATGNIKSLLDKLELISALSPSVLATMGEASKNIINCYSFKKIEEGLRSLPDLNI